MANQYNLLPFTTAEIIAILEKARDGKMLTIDEYNALKNIQFGNNIQLDNYVTHTELQEILTQYALKSYVDEKETTIKQYVRNEITNALGNGSGSGGNIDLSAYQTKRSISLLPTNDQTIEGAITELFQFANNGKNTIATAIGSPLSKSDTFTAMGNKINTLSTDLAKSINTSSLTTAMASEKLGPLTNKAINVINSIGDVNQLETDAKIIVPAINELLNNTSGGNIGEEDTEQPVYNNQIEPGYDFRLNTNDSEWAVTSSVTYDFTNKCYGGVTIEYMQRTYLEYNSGRGTTTINVIRNGSPVSGLSYTISTNATVDEYDWTFVSKNLTGLMPNDIIRLTIKGAGNNTTFVENFTITFNIVQ